jgi:hypothetical protein
VGFGGAFLNHQGIVAKAVPHKKAVLQPPTPDKPFYNEHGAAWGKPFRVREAGKPMGVACHHRIK